MLKNKYDLIKSPVITEKSTNLGELNKYVFNVCPRAKKSSIKEAIETIFGTKVKSVNILNRKGKVKKFKGRVGVRSDMKKAIVTLEDQNETIDVTRGVK